MIKLIDLINERKQVGTLYHFTKYDNMIDIINENFILKSIHGTLTQPYISFTRNKAMSSDTILDQVRIVIDGSLLSDRYKLEPHADAKAGYGRSSVDESEERVSMIRYPKGVDILKCLIRIDVKKPTNTGAAKDLDPEDEDFIEPPFMSKYLRLIDMLKQKNIPYSIVEKHK